MVGIIAGDSVNCNYVTNRSVKYADAANANVGKRRMSRQIMSCLQSKQKLDLNNNKSCFPLGVGGITNYCLNRRRSSDTLMLMNNHGDELAVAAASKNSVSSGGHGKGFDGNDLTHIFEELLHIVKICVAILAVTMNSTPVAFARVLLTFAGTIFIVVHTVSGLPKVEPYSRDEWLERRKYWSALSNVTLVTVVVGNAILMLWTPYPYYPLMFSLICSWLAGIALTPAAIRMINYGVLR